MIFDIAGNVPSDQEQLIRAGFALAHDYFARVMGGDIADSVKKELSELMDDYGYGIIKALVTDIDPDPKVKAAYLGAH